MNMKRIICLVWLLSSFGWATNDLRILPSATMPLTEINGVTAIDLRLIGRGDLVSFDIRFENIDFNFAGCEFKIYHPIFLASLSPDPQDWQLNQGAVFVPGSQLGEHPLVLPVDGSGNRTAAHPTLNANEVRLGVLFTDSESRWSGTPQQPHPGGLLGRISYRYNGSPQTSSLLESVQVRLDPLYDAQGQNDYFTNAQGSRVAIVNQVPMDVHGLAGEPAYMGYPQMWIRADADRNGARNALDALPAARCAMEGQNSPNCPWQGISSAAFVQTFDINCDEMVNALDALGLARLALGQRDRTVSSANTFDGNVRLGNGENQQAALVLIRLVGDHLSTKPSIELMGSREWQIVTQTDGTQADILMLHRGGGGRIPEIQLSWGAPTRFQVVEALFQEAGGPVQLFQPMITNL